MKTRSTSSSPSRKTVGQRMTPTTGVTRNPVMVIMLGSRPRIRTPAGSMPTSSCASRSAVCSGRRLAGVAAPAGKGDLPLVALHTVSPARVEDVPAVFCFDKRHEDGGAFEARFVRDLDLGVAIRRRTLRRSGRCEAYLRYMPRLFPSSDPTGLRIGARVAASCRGRDHSRRNGLPQNAHSAVMSSSHSTSSG